ncbi:hypothetical protein [Ensifer sp.]|uniref:hypothetical protein n=1 Tax=Ensifer sp. TaxID=1872086 RepID=UPI002E143DE6|nr:hypothetical protein [Ensifer sp.]
MADVNGEMTHRRQRGPARSLIFGLILVASLPAYAKFAGQPFVPSVEWMAVSSRVGSTGGLFFAIAFFWSTWRREHGIRGGGIGGAVGLLGSTLAGYFIGRHAVAMACPMALALVGGHPVELPFTVADADPRHSRRCGSSIELRDVPPVYNGLCDVSSDRGRGLEPGAHIRVSGHGTRWGVYIMSVRPGD